MREPRVAQHVREPGDRDPTRPEVLVPVRARRERRPRVVEVDQGQAIEADAPIEPGEERVDDRRIADVDAGSPRVGEVEAEPDVVRGRCPRRSRPSAIATSSSSVRAEAATATGRVLEDERRRLADDASDAREHLRDAVDEPGDADLDARRRDATRCGR